MDVRELVVDDLVLDQNLNLRDRLDPEAIERYAEAWSLVPPVTVFEVDGRWLLADGFHRHAAALSLDVRMIPAHVQQGTFADALSFAAGANLAHGLPLTRAERRRAAETKLKIHHDRSDRRIAEETGLGRDLIARVRKQLADAGQIPATPARVGADGKVYPSAGLPRDPNEHRPTDRSAPTRDDPRDRGRSEADPAPWDDTVDPMPAHEPRATIAPPPWDATAPWDDAAAKSVALAPPIAPAALTIDEMLTMMTNQVMDIVAWSEDADFAAAYLTASPDTRGLFQTAALRLAARVDQLRKS